MTLNSYRPETEQNLLRKSLKSCQKKGLRATEARSQSALRFLVFRSFLWKMVSQIKVSSLPDAKSKVSTSRQSPDERRQSYMKLTMSAFSDERARQQLERVQEKRLKNLVDFQTNGGEYVKPAI